MRTPHLVSCVPHNNTPFVSPSCFIPSSPVSFVPFVSFWFVGAGFRWMYSATGLTRFENPCFVHIALMLRTLLYYTLMKESRKMVI